MRNAALLIFISIIPCTCTDLHAQDSRIIQVSGVVVATDSLIPMPYVTIYRESDQRGTYSDYTGYFTLPIRTGDTLHFECIGLKDSFYIVPEDTALTHLSVVQLMETDTLTMAPITIYPYPKPSELRKEVLALDLPGDNFVKFSREKPDISAYDGMYDLAEQSVSREQELLNARISNGLVYGGNLLDGAAWKSFFGDIRRKPKKQ